jgi:hypothetical protein
MKSWSWAISLVVGPALILGLASLSGCGGGSQEPIPLIKIPDPPKLEPVDKSKYKAPPGTSPEVLP